MANTVDQTTNKCIQVTMIPMNAGDVAFTFDGQLRRAQVQASAATSSMYVAAASSGHAAIVLPNGQSAGAIMLEGEDFAGQAVTFNGTNGTNVTVIEYLYAST